jgi:tetrahydromethanopterin S-methyltransferase subunit G
MHVVMRESWTDERLDEFGKRMDERFDRVDERFNRVDERVKAVQGEMRQEFAQVDKQLDRLGNGLEMVQKAIIFGAIAMSSAFVAGFVTMATQI